MDFVCVYHLVFGIVYGMFDDILKSSSMGGARRLIFPGIRRNLCNNYSLVNVRKI